MRLKHFQNKKIVHDYNELHKASEFSFLHTHVVSNYKIQDETAYRSHIFLQKLIDNHIFFEKLLDHAIVCQ